VVVLRMMEMMRMMLSIFRRSGWHAVPLHKLDDLPHIWVATPFIFASSTIVRTLYVRTG